MKEGKREVSECVNGRERSENRIPFYSSNRPVKEKVANYVFSFSAASRVKVKVATGSHCSLIFLSDPTNWRHTYYFFFLE